MLIFYMLIFYILIFVSSTIASSNSEVSVDGGGSRVVVRVDTRIFESEDFNEVI